MSLEPNNAAAPPGESVDLRGFVYALLEFKWHVLVVMAGVTAAIAAWTFRQEPIYQASCSIEYDPNPARPLGNDFVDPVGSILFTREFIETQNHIITSRNVAERVVTKLALHRDPDFLRREDDSPEALARVEVADAARLLQDRIAIDGVRDTRVVWVRVEDHNRDRAPLLANAIVDAYLEKTIEDRLGTTVAALEWLSTQLDSLRHQLEGSELALHEFKRDNNVLSVSLEDRQNLVANDIQHFNQALTEARGRRIALSARLAQLRSANREDPFDVRATAVDDNPRVVELRHRAAEKQQELEAASLRYGEAHPAMRSLRSEVDSIRSQLRREIDGIIRAAELDVREVHAVEGGLRQALDEANAAGLALNLREIEYSRLNRERENTSKLYSLLLERTTETDLARMMRFTHVRVVDRAVTPFRPIRPRVVFNLALGSLMGLLFGLGLAFGLSRLDRRIRTPEDVEALGVQVLGVVPATDATNTSNPGRRKRAAEDVSRDLLVHTKSLSSFAESIRGIRTNLTFMFPDAPLRCIVVTSAGQGEGKTTVACNLAIALAQSSKRVLFVDTDLRRPRVHRIFGLGSDRGITNALVGEASLDDVIATTEIPNLSVLRCGPTPPNPAELLHTKRFAALLSEAKKSFDFVVMDSSPLGAVADAAVIAAQVDGVVMVVQADRTTRDSSRAALRQLQDVGSRFVGAVLNAVDTSSPRYGRGSEYYASSRYYAEEDAGADSDADEALAARTRS